MAIGPGQEDQQHRDGDADPEPLRSSDGDCFGLACALVLSDQGVDPRSWKVGQLRKNPPGEGAATEGCEGVGAEMTHPVGVGEDVERAK